MANVINEVEDFLKKVGAEARKIEAKVPSVVDTIQKDLTNYAQPLEAMLVTEFPGAAVPAAFSTALLQAGLTCVADVTKAADANGLNPTTDQAFILAVKTLISLFKSKPAVPAAK